MKKFNIIFRYTSGAIVSLVALVFAVLETTLLVTLDFTLYENPAIALIQLLLRLLIASSALALGILSIVNRTRSYLPHSLCLLTSSVTMIPFVINNIAIYFTVISVLFLLSQLLTLNARDEGNKQDSISEP